MIGAVTRWVTIGSPGSIVYLKGGFGYGHPVFGLSDVDAIVVTPGDQSGPGEVPGVEARWRALRERSPALDQLFQLWVYDREDLGLLEDSYLTFGLDHTADWGVGDAAFLGASAPRDPMGLLDHPGLYGPRRDWRRLGSPRRAPAPVSEPTLAGHCAWLELRFIWGHAFRLSVDCTPISAAYICQKLVSDSARVWLWLRFGEQLFSRASILARALDLMPEEEEALRAAQELGKALHREPAPPLSQALGFLTRTSSRIARELTSRAAAAGSTEVELVWDGPDELLCSSDAKARAGAIGAARGEPELLPLLDWRARAIPGILDPVIAFRAGDPSAPDLLAELARANDDAFFPSLWHDGLLVMPTPELWHRGRLRGIECRCTDPVSTALGEGASVASFPALPGWSAEDCARRALAEHRAWLHCGRPLPEWVIGECSPDLIELCGLLTAARAVLFADTLQDGAPELALTAAAIVRSMARYGAEIQAAAEDAYEALRACRDKQGQPDVRAVASLRRAVLELPFYRSAGLGARR